MGFSSPSPPKSRPPPPPPPPEADPSIEDAVRLRNEIERRRRGRGAMIEPAVRPDILPAGIQIPTRI